jgi:hypothetical protein
MAVMQGAHGGNESDVPPVESRAEFGDRRHDLGLGHGSQG